MPPPLPVFARRHADRIAFADALPLAVRFDNLRTRDGFDAVAHVAVTVRAVDKPADRQMFAEQFLAGRETASPDDVQRHVASSLAPTAVDLAAAKDAADLLADRATSEKTIADRVDAIAFACGLERLGPLTLTLDCPGLLQQQQRDSARRQQQAAAEHAAKLAASLAAVGPAHRLPVADQAALLPTLLAAMPPAPAILAAGPNVVRIDSAGELLVHAAPADIGPLRCVRKLDDGYAVGGVNGVALLDAEFEPTELFKSVGSGRGFNSVARRGDSVAAVHGEIGLVVWYGGESQIFATPGPARHLVAVADRLFFAAGGTLCAFDGGVRLIEEHESPVVALLPFGDAVVAVRRDGTLRTWSATSQRPVAEARTNVAVSAAAALHAGGLQAVVLADDRGRIDAYTLAGQPLGRLAVQSGEVRMLAFAGGRVFAVTADRASVTVFDPATGEPPRTINVLARTGHHVTDLIEG